MSIGEYCNRDVIIARKSATISEIAQLMREYHVGTVVIAKNDNGLNIPIGIITDRDIVVEVIAAGVNLESVTASDIMSNEIHTVREINGLWETITHMKHHGVRRMPVINDEKVLVGIVSIDDLLEVLSDQMNELIKIISNEQHREKSHRNRL